MYVLLANRESRNYQANECPEYVFATFFENASHEKTRMRVFIMYFYAVFWMCYIDLQFILKLS